MSSQFILEPPSQSISPIAHVILDLIAQCRIPLRLFVSPHATDESMTVRGPNKQPASALEHAMQFNQAFMWLIHVFNHMVIENQVERVGIKRQVADACDLKIQLRLPMKLSWNEIINVNGINMSLKLSLYPGGFVTRSTTRDQDPLPLLDGAKFAQLVAEELCASVTNNRLSKRGSLKTHGGLT